MSSPIILTAINKASFVNQMDNLASGDAAANVDTSLDFEHQVVPNGDSGIQAAPKGDIGIQVVPNGDSGIQAAPNGDSGIQVVPNGDSGIQAAPNGDSGIQAAPNGGMVFRMRITDLNVYEVRNMNGQVVFRIRPVSGTFHSYLEVMNATGGRVKSSKKLIWTTHKKCIGYDYVGGKRVPQKAFSLFKLRFWGPAIDFGVNVVEKGEKIFYKISLHDSQMSCLISDADGSKKLAEVRVENDEKIITVFHPLDPVFVFLLIATIDTIRRPSEWKACGNLLGFADRLSLVLKLLELFRDPVRSLMVYLGYKTDPKAVPVAGQV